ncbi:hypothetical protein [Microbacterium sp. RG1]|uniref:hypothetical protein n=1 Tax=Microbacterium sp. RG1 TaxID=2489212 RepID=UPI0010CA5E4A|nr:hypothetical protein [Microbacterium sp. RG1]QCQ17047.1 hypothetical protein EHF32_10120 [Microbacterium sp. RG1]
MRRAHDTESIVYCTIVARNYLPQALALQESVARVEPGRELKIMVVDGDVPSSIAPRDNCEFVGLDYLGLGDREVHNLAMIYDVVELSTGVKPRFLQRLLESYKRAVYLDPDMQVVSPLDELPALIDEFGVVLTPHILEPIPPGETFTSEINTLTVGVHNLGFCAVGPAGAPFLDWWWSHLQRECLIYPLLGLFVDQKWTDIGSVMFAAHSLRHRGYNIGHWNLQEREIVVRADEYEIASNGDPVRLMHFSGFDPRDPEAISVRQNIDLRDKGLGNDALLTLSRSYAEVLLAAQRELGAQPAYGYDKDSNGRGLSKRLRRAYRRDLTDPTAADPPSAFDPSWRREFAAWRRRSLRSQTQTMSTDAAIAFKYAFPDTFGRLKRALPSVFGRVRGSLLRRSQIRR